MLLRNFDRRFKNRGDASPLSPRKERSARSSYRQLIDFRAVRQYLFFREHVLDRLLSLLDVLHVLVSLHHRAHGCTRFFFAGGGPTTTETIPSRRKTPPLNERRDQGLVVLN